MLIKVQKTIEKIMTNKNRNTLFFQKFQPTNQTQKGNTNLPYTLEYQAKTKHNNKINREK